MSTTASKILIRLTKFSNKTSNVLNVTEQFNATGVFYQDLSGWDEAIVQIVTPSEAISFKTTNDDGAITGQLLPAPEVPINWLTVQGVKLSDGAAASSVTTSETVKFTSIGKYLQLVGATVASAPSFAYLLSRESNSVAANACASGILIGNKVVYASTATPTSVTSFYIDSALTQRVFGNSDYYALKLMTGSTIYSATISPTGVVASVTSC